MSNFNIADYALKTLCPGNEMLYDNKHFPSVTVMVPKMTWANLGVGTSTDIFPAWIVDGKEVDCLYFSKYGNVASNDCAYSLPQSAPTGEVTADEAFELSANKGVGWHSATRLEYAALALITLLLGKMPLGNNNNGKDVTESAYDATAATYDENGNILKVTGGSGPLSWSHDRAITGVWDLNGNTREWNSGIRLVNGELQVISNDRGTFGNDAADADNSQGESSALWLAIDGTTGKLIIPNGEGTTKNSVKADWQNSRWIWVTDELTSQENKARKCRFVDIDVDASVSPAAARLLQALALYPISNINIALDDAVTLNNGGGEMFFTSGGSYESGADAGVFCTDAVSTREDKSEDIGFRSTYCDF